MPDNALPASESTPPVGNGTPPTAADRTPGNEPATVTGNPAPQPPPESLPSIPGYALLEQLDDGGMGIVYKALQLSLSRLVALKMIKAAKAHGARQLTRFRTEAEAVASLEHPH